MMTPVECAGEASGSSSRLLSSPEKKAEHGEEEEGEKELLRRRRRRLLLAEGLLDRFLREPDKRGAAVALLTERGCFRSSLNYFSCCCSAGCELER